MAPSPSPAPIAGIDMGCCTLRATLHGQPAPVSLPTFLALKPQDVATWPPYDVGHQARRRALMRPLEVARAWPSLLARRAGSSTCETYSERSGLTVAAAANEAAVVQLGATSLGAEEGLAHLFGAVLTELARDGGTAVREAVITIPAAFSTAERRALGHAARIAGLDVAALLPAPVAAGLAVLQAAAARDVPEQLEAEVPADEQAAAPPTPEREATEAPTQNDAVEAEAEAAEHAPSPPSAQEAQPEAAPPCQGPLLVLDIGSQHSDVAILHQREARILVQALASDATLGGDAADDVLTTALCSDFFEAHGIDLRQDPTAHARLRDAVHKMRARLSTEPHTELNLPFIAATAQGPLHLHQPIDRALLTAALADWIAGQVALCQRALAQRGPDAEPLATLFITGGMAETPGLIEALAPFQVPVVLLDEEAAVRGAAFWAQAMDHKALSLHLPKNTDTEPQDAWATLSTEAVEAIVAHHRAATEEMARRAAHAALMGRAQAALASLRVQAPVEGMVDTASEDGRESVWAPVQRAMEAVHTALEQPADAEGHALLTQVMQQLDVACAQWQRSSKDA